MSIELFFSHLKNTTRENWQNVYKKIVDFALFSTVVLGTACTCKLAGLSSMRSLSWAVRAVMSAQVKVVAACLAPTLLTCSFTAPADFFVSLLSAPRAFYSELKINISTHFYISIRIIFRIFNKMDCKIFVFSCLHLLWFWVNMFVLNLISQNLKKIQETQNYFSFVKYFHLFYKNSIKSSKI